MLIADEGAEREDPAEVNMEVTGVWVCVFELRMLWERFQAYKESHLDYSAFS